MTRTLPLRPLILSLIALTALASACGGEEPVPVNLDGTRSSESGEATDEPTIDPGENSQANQMVIDAANQQCLDDPDLEEGVVQIVHQESGEVVNVTRVDCEDVRLLESDGVLGSEDE